MSKIKKRIIYFLLVTSTLLLLEGCSCQAVSMKEKSSTKQDDCITIWAWDENFNILAVNRAIEKYEKSHDKINLKVINMSQEETIAKLSAAIISGSDELLPEIVLIEDYRIQHYLNNYRDEFEDLSDFAKKEQFASYKMGINQINDRIYGVPFDSGVVGLFYRLDYIEAAGYTEQDMRSLTWEKYIEIGKEVKKKTGKYMLTLDPSDLPLIRMMLQSAGEWYCDAQGKVNIYNNKALVDAILVYKSIVEAGIAKPVSDWNQFIKAFQSGESASVVSGAWISPSIAETKSQAGLWRVAQLPRMEKNSYSVNASSVGGSGFYIMKNSSNAQAAKNFLKETFASDAALLEGLVDEINLVSALKSVEESYKYKEGVSFYGNQTIYTELIEWSNKIPAINYGEDTYQIEEYVAESIQKILTGEDIRQTLLEYQKKYIQDHDG